MVLFTLTLPFEEKNKQLRCRASLLINLVDENKLIAFTSGKWKFFTLESYL